MLLAVEIILTVVAWRKGWRGYALVPIILGLLIGFMIGALANLIDYSESQIKQLSLILIPLDFVCIGILGWMITKSHTRHNYMNQKEKLNLEPSKIITKHV